MSICPHTCKQCSCQPQEGVMCPYGDTPEDWRMTKNDVAQLRERCFCITGRPVACIVCRAADELEPKAPHIKTWRERCDELHDDMVVVSSRLVQQRMQEEIDDLRSALNRRASHE